MRVPISLLVTAVLLCVCGPALGTPSSVIWTFCTMNFQPPNTTRVGVDTFFGIGSNQPDRTDQLSIDVGPEWGYNLGDKGALEVGFDVVSSPSPTWFYANFKIGYPENRIASSAPALEIGVFGLGTKSSVNNQRDIVQFIVGKTLGKVQFSASYYVGNAAALKSSSGATENDGYMVSLLAPVVPCKWSVGADYCSGENIIGGGGLGAFYFFTKDISLMAGPVWYNDKGLNGSTKATVQFDINF